MASFGENLKRLRTERKLSQSELAGLVKMHSTHISRYEREQAKPTVDVVRRIAQTLNVSADQLIYGDAQQVASGRIQDHELLNMFSRVQELTSEDIDCVKSLLNAYILKSDLQEKLSTK